MPLELYARSTSPSFYARIEELEVLCIIHDIKTLPVALITEIRERPTTGIPELLRAHKLLKDTVNG